MDVSDSERALSEPRDDGIAEVLAQYAEVEAFEGKCRLNCGRLALWFLAQRLGKLPSESEVSGMSLPADGKMSVADVIREGKKKYSLRLAARRLTSLKQIPPDSILVIGERHCVVLVGWQDDLPIVFEPSRVRLELLQVARDSSRKMSQSPRRRTVTKLFS